LARDAAVGLLVGVVIVGVAVGVAEILRWRLDR
jgi:hypothetical protein